MKAAVKSVSSRICEKVAHGDCTILVSKTAPKCEVPFKAYIYCTKEKPYLYLIDYDDDNFELIKQNGKVIGEFVCDKVISTCGWRLQGDTQWCAKRTTDEEMFPSLACLTIDEIIEYAGNNRGIYGWHITDLKIYDKPRELSEFRISRSPQSWQYIEEI